MSSSAFLDLLALLSRVAPRPQAVTLAAVLLLALGLPLAADTPDGNTPDAAMNRLYNFDFVGAHRVLDAYNAAHPNDALGHALQGATFMFGEFARLQILESEFFEDDKKFAEKKGLRYDPVVRQQFYGEIDIARKLALATLAKDPNNQDALFVMTISGGLLTDFTSLIEKKNIASLGYAKEAQGYAVRLLAINPNYGDAYLTTGFSEYLVGSLPFFVKWFTHFDNTEGNKSEAITKLLKVSQTGHYLAPFAKILLAIIYLREKQPHESEKLLRELSAAYPDNPLLRKELAKVKQVAVTGGS